MGKDWGFDFKIWTISNSEVIPGPTIPSRSSESNIDDMKTMWFVIAQGDSPVGLRRELANLLNQIDCAEWRVPETLPKDIVEWSFTLETEAYDIGPHFVTLIARDSLDRKWLWDYDGTRDDRLNPTPLLFHYGTRG